MGYIKKLKALKLATKKFKNILNKANKNNPCSIVQQK